MLFPKGIVCQKTLLIAYEIFEFINNDVYCLRWLRCLLHDILFFIMKFVVMIKPFTKIQFEVLQELGLSTKI